MPATYTDGRAARQAKSEKPIADGKFVARRSLTYEALVAAAVRRGCSPAEFIVRLELASRGDERGANCRPSGATLARDGMMAVKTVRAALNTQRAKGGIDHQGRDALGIDVWRVRLPDEVPDYIHGRMVMRAFQHRLKPLPRAVLVVIAASADKAGHTNGFCPSMDDLCGWFGMSEDAIGRALKLLIQLGLIRLVKRAGGAAGDAAQYDVTMGPTAMAWTPLPRAVAERPANDTDWSAKMPGGGPQFCQQPLCSYH